MRKTRRKKIVTRKKTDYAELRESIRAALSGIRRARAAHRRAERLTARIYKVKDDGNGSLRVTRKQPGDFFKIFAASRTRSGRRPRA